MNVFHFTQFSLFCILSLQFKFLHSNVYTLIILKQSDIACHIFGKPHSAYPTRFISLEKALKICKCFFLDNLNGLDYAPCGA